MGRWATRGEVDASRRTWLAAERTWLAWWRTALGGVAVAMGVGCFLPSLTGGSRWPYAFVGIGYGVIAVAVLMTGWFAKKDHRGAAGWRLL